MDERTTASDMPAGRRIPLHTRPELEEGILTALNGPFYALQVAIGQDDGGIASLYASGTLEELAADLADSMEKAGWDRTQVPAWVDTDNSRLLPVLETTTPTDMPDALLDTAVGDFLKSIAGQTGLDPEAAFDAFAKDRVTEYFRGYLSYEGSYRMTP